MRKTLRIFILFIFPGTLFPAQVQARTETLQLSEKVSINLDEDFLGRENAGWLYLPKKQQALVYRKDFWKFVSLETGKVVRTIPPIRTNLSKFLAQLSPDEDKVVFYDIFGKESELWNLQNGKLIAVLPKQKERIYGIEWSADNRFFIYSDTFFSIQKENSIFSAETGKIHTVVKTRFKASVSFSPDGKFILTGEKNISYRRNNLLKLWNVENGDLVKDFTFPDKHQSFSAVFTPDGGHVFARDRDEFSAIDIKTGEIAYSIKGNGVYKFSPSGNLAAIYKEDFRGFTKHDETVFEIYDLKTGNLIKEIKTGKPDKNQVEIHQMIWSPDGKYLASAGERYSGKYEAEMWRIPDGKSKFLISPLVAKRNRNPFEGGYDNYDTIGFTPDSRYLITNNSLAKENQIKIWDAETGKFLKNISGAEKTLFLTSDNRYFTKIDKKNLKITFYEIN